MQEVAAGAEGAHPKGTIGAAWDVPATAACRPLLLGAVNKQTAGAVDTIPGCVEGAAQLSLVLGMARGHMEVMEAMGKLAALSILAGASLCIAAAELCLVACGAHPRDQGWRWRLD